MMNLRTYFLVIVFTMLISPAVFADENQISVHIDGEVQDYDQTPIIEQGRTLVPLRGIFESLGLNVDWNQETMIIDATGEKNISLQIGEREAYVDGEIVLLDVPAKIINERTLVPLRFISEAMGAEVNWNSSNRLVTVISTPEDKSGNIDLTLNAPTGVKAVVSDNETINIIWDIVDNVDHYYVYYSSNYAGLYEPFTQNGNKAPFIYGVEDQGVMEGETWYYKVSAVKNGIESELSEVAYATVPSNTIIYDSLKLVADDPDNTFLGNVTTNKYSTDSIFNEYGTYGSEYGQYSIWNRFGQYGGSYSTYSAFNEYSYSPPMIIDSNGNVLARVTNNSFIQNGIHPNNLYETLRQLGY